jgi:hypothetical protein
MNSKKYNMLLAGLMCLGLGACSTSPDRINASTINSGELYGETAGGVGMVTGPAMAGASASGSSGSSAMDSSRAGSSGASTYGGTSSSGAYGSGSSSGGAAMNSGASSGGSSSADVQSPGMTSYGVIHSIDAIPRTQAFGSAASMGGVGAQSGSSGAMTGSSSDMVYRVTLRMDDGSTRAVIQETRPSFQTGDRVRMASNLLQRY